MKKALVILSGGQDSTTCLALACRRYDEVAAITFNYGQRHARELQAAADVAKICGIKNHWTVTIGPILQGASPLTDMNQTLEQYADYQSMDSIIGDRIEKTFVPMRNALFLTIAANYAVANGYSTLVTGVCEADNANYPDCRASFIASQEATINEALGTTGTPAALTIETPLIYASKAESIHALNEIHALPLLGFSHTAYDGSYPPVGSDHATILRAEGFVQSGMPDPLVLRAVATGLMPLPATANYANAEMNDICINMMRGIAESHGLTF